MGYVWRDLVQLLLECFAMYSTTSPKQLCLKRSVHCRQARVKAFRIWLGQNDISSCCICKYRAAQVLTLLQVLALFAGQLYDSSLQNLGNLDAHLTNTCRLGGAVEEEQAVRLLSELPLVRHLLPCLTTPTTQSTFCVASAPLLLKSACDLTRLARHELAQILPGSAAKESVRKSLWIHKHSVEIASLPPMHCCKNSMQCTQNQARARIAPFSETAHGIAMLCPADQCCVTCLYQQFHYMCAVFFDWPLLCKTLSP